MSENLLSQIADLHAQISKASKEEPDRRKRDLKQDALYGQLERLEAQAAQRFAAANNWRVTTHSFSLEDLRGSKNMPRHHWGRYILHGLFMDHCTWFRSREKPYRPAAVVTQPYNAPPDRVIAAYAENYPDLRVHMPAPDWEAIQQASWYLPGRTGIYCLAPRSLGRVHWLPEQARLETRASADVATSI